jgi:hypothetical protein
LEDRQNSQASINFQNDPEKRRYYSNLKKTDSELIQEEYVLKVKSENSFELQHES